MWPVVVWTGSSCANWLKNLERMWRKAKRRFQNFSHFALLVKRIFRQASAPHSAAKEGRLSQWNARKCDALANWNASAAEKIIHNQSSRLCCLSQMWTCENAMCEGERARQSDKRNKICRFSASFTTIFRCIRRPHLRGWLTRGSLITWAEFGVYLAFLPSENRVGDFFLLRWLDKRTKMWKATAELMVDTLKCFSKLLVIY